MRADALSLAVAIGLAASPVHSQQVVSTWTQVPATAVFATGDSWADHGVSYRLYGVQACLRGTFFTNAHGQKRDCGEASLAMLVALIRDLHPQCMRAGAGQPPRAMPVICIAQPSTGAAAGSRIDLDTALIATGFAFAALGPDRLPIHPPYAVAEQVARQGRAGLWAFADLPDPNAIILRALNARHPSAGTPAALPEPIIPEPTLNGDTRP